MIRIAVILSVLPFFAFADPVTIRSGEHDTFSRLVISIGPNTGWSVEPNEGGFVLELEGRSDGFDTSQVFERIQRARLNDLRQSAPNALNLLVGVDSEVEAFLWKPGYLVVDIKEGPEPNPIRSSVGFGPLNIVANPPPESLEDYPQIFPNFLTFSPLPTETNDEAPSKNEQAPTDLSATEEALAIGIARAASQGFLEPATVVNEEPEISNEVPELEQIHTQEETDTIVAPGRPGVGISTAMDRDLAQLGIELGRSLDQQCLPADLFQIDAWGDFRGFHEQASSLTEALAGEFGVEPREAQESLARLYLHFGFGAEAKLVLAADPASSQSRIILTELAGIIDDYDGEYPAIRAQEGCNSPGALWAFLLHPTKLEANDRNKLIHDFLALPQPLRSQISPRLARRFLDVGDLDAANQLLNAADSQDANTTHEVQSARALISESANDPEAAVTVLSNEADDNARTTPQSLIRLIELELEQGLIPSEANLLLAGALRQEHRDTPIENDLANAEALGRIASGQYQVALDLVQSRDDAEAYNIVDQTFAHIVAHAETGTFLEFTFSETPEELSSETENAVSRRLIDLGFFERASTFLIGNANGEEASERRYLLAETALGTGEFDVAIDALLGMTDERARTLRARAFEGLGQHRAALAALSVDQPASSPALQFRAGAWERLTVEEDEILSTFANSVLQPPNETPVATLAERREILTQSRNSRQSVEDLLQRFSLESPEN
ncbi:hypothetical protein [Octadecabacter ascidiaceicola]|uniref:Tetratricopeptide repeat protein n=1 Tax=Octadecabacter ascidiaceicola TaxID=1655543 RepID=A0A238KCW1_9RHOB|nr:hypothetical protein [Octadecabacter ascidiaceicola]SMX40377.1 hypothetical protein OCA8868_02364 [Octadecabacter ascidiaceicola]